jgi:Mrp family chromosome partitioning ATPase
MHVNGVLDAKKTPSGQKNAVVWQGLMVQKATQQLLFGVDWRKCERDQGLDFSLSICHQEQGMSH